MDYEVFLGAHPAGERNGLNCDATRVQQIDLVPEEYHPCGRRYGHSREDIEKTIENAALYELDRLEKRMGVLATTANVAPMLGLSAFGPLASKLIVLLVIGIFHLDGPGSSCTLLIVAFCVWVVATSAFGEMTPPRDPDVGVYIRTAGLAATIVVAVLVWGRCFSLVWWSGGAVLLTAGAKGKRAALPNSRVMIHQPLGGTEGQASDIEIQAKEILWMKARLTEIIADHSGQDVETVSADADRNYWLGADEAKEYGLIDNVLLPQELNKSYEKE